VAELPDGIILVGRMAGPWEAVIRSTLGTRAHAEAAAREFVAQSKRAGALEERARIMELFGKVGADMMDNAKEVSELDGQAMESRARMFAGILVTEVAEILYTEIRTAAFEERASELLSDIEKTLGPERWAEVKRDAEAAIAEKEANGG